MMPHALPQELNENECIIGCVKTTKTNGKTNAIVPLGCILKTIKPTKYGQNDCIKREKLLNCIKKEKLLN